MEYIIGSLVTIVTVVVTNKIVSRQLKIQESIPKIKYRQSHIYDLLKPYLVEEGYHKYAAKRQSSDYQNRAYTKVVIAEDTAYWIKDNSLFTAKVIEGNVDSETTQPVDTMNMSNKELNKLMVIVEALREGDDNDNRSTGNQKL
jgi:hypothetical protein